MNPHLYHSIQPTVFKIPPELSALPPGTTYPLCDYTANVAEFFGESAYSRSMCVLTLDTNYEEAKRQIARGAPKIGTKVTVAHHGEGWGLGFVKPKDNGREAWVIGYRAGTGPGGHDTMFIIFNKHVEFGFAECALLSFGQCLIDGKILSETLTSKG